MNRRIGAVLGALATTIALASAGIATASTHLTLTAGINVVGISNTAPLSEADYDIRTAAALHARLVRVDAPWSLFEPNGPGQIDPQTQAFADRLMADAAAAGIKVILIAESTPCWASSAPSSLMRSCRPNQLTKANAYPPTEDSAYAAFVSYLAQRYGPDLAAIEVWNEPDQANEDYFAGPEKPARYAAVLRAAYPAIKAVDPSLPVLGGSLVGSNGRFLRQLYAAGIKGFYDGLSVHFYNLTLASVRSIHEVQLENGDPTPLWLNEFGWSSCYPRQLIEQEQGCVTEAVQAQNLTNALRELATSGYVQSALVYKLQDSAGEHFGVLGQAGGRKRSYTALANALANPARGAVSRVTLSLRRRGRSVVASGSGPVGDYMGLEAFSGKTLRYKVLFTLNRFNRYSLKLPSVLGTRGLRVRVFQYWQGRARGAVKSI